MKALSCKIYHYQDGEGSKSLDITVANKSKKILAQIYLESRFTFLIRAPVAKSTKEIKGDATGHILTELEE